MDLAVVPGSCTSEFWSEIVDTLRDYGGSLTAIYVVRAQREQTCKRERETHPDTWGWDWWDLGRPRGQQVLGYLIGDDPPDPLPARG